MADFTWNGGNGVYDDPANWSPLGPPNQPGVPSQPGDLGIVTNGTLQLSQLDLTGVATQISSQSGVNPVTLDVKNTTLGQVFVTDFLGSFVPVADINTTGHVASNFIGLGGGIEGLNFGSTLDLNIGGGHFKNIGTIDEETFSQLNVTGNGKFANDGTITITGSSAIVDTNVVGTGTITEQIGIDLHPSFLEFGAKVGAGQTINLDGTQMVIDNAAKFQALINFAEPPPPPGIGLEEVELKGIAATASSYAGGVLSVFEGNQLAAALRINANDPQVTSSGGNTFITTT